MPRGSMKHLQLMAGRIYNLLKKEAAYSPNTQHLDDFSCSAEAREITRQPDGQRFDCPKPL
jgi:hypothetical protein